MAPPVLFFGGAARCTAVGSTRLESRNGSTPALAISRGPAAAAGGRLRRRRHGRPSHAVAALVLLLALGLASFLALHRTRLVRQPGLSVLLVTIDTLRADALGCYGKTDAGTPWMDRLAAAGVRFEDAHAHNVVTLPSHANILSGRYPFDHGVRDNSGFRFPSGTDTFATLLKARGYRTGAFVSAFPVDSRFGLTRGFDVYDDRFGDAGTHTAFRMQERPGPRRSRQPAPGWRPGRRPDLLLGAPLRTALPVSTARAPGLALPGPTLPGRGGGGGRGVGAPRSSRCSRGRAGRTLVVLTADHGEGLGEHGEMTHGIFAYEGTLRVPLLLFQPGIPTPAVVAARAARGPAADRAGCAGPAAAGSLARPQPAAAGRGRPAAKRPATSRRWRLRSTVAGRRCTACSGTGPSTSTSRSRSCSTSHPTPASERISSARAPARRDEARALLVRLRSSDRGVERDSESAEVRERLAGLGYVAAGNGLKPRYAEADDPKRNVGFENDLEAVIDRYVQGDLRGALALCEGSRAAAPARTARAPPPLVPAAQDGDLPGAIDAGRRALQADAGSAEAAAESGSSSTTWAGHRRQSPSWHRAYRRRMRISTCCSPTACRWRGPDGATKRWPPREGRARAPVQRGRRRQPRNGPADVR